MKSHDIIEIIELIEIIVIAIFLNLSCQHAKLTLFRLYSDGNYRKYDIVACVMQFIKDCREGELWLTPIKT
jgi:hypothetical protein